MKEKHFEVLTVGFSLLLLSFLSGCMAAPDFQGVDPWIVELHEARHSINYEIPPEPRYLEASKWRETLERVVERIKPAARKVCESIGGVDCELIGLSIQIVDDPTINAFVNEYNVVSVHSGLLHYAASDEEIAAVIAHEWGHVFANHLAKISRNELTGAAIGGLVALLGGYFTQDWSNSAEVTEEFASIGISANRPEFELEADYWAAMILETANIDLKHGEILLLRLAKASQNLASGWGDSIKLMAATHPTSDWRLAKWKAIANTFKFSREASPSQLDSELRVAALRTLISSARDAQLLKGTWDVNFLTRWINSKNGHSGSMRLLHVRIMDECYDEKAQKTGICIKIRQTDRLKAAAGSLVGYLCYTPPRTESEQTWSWKFMGPKRPWRLFKDGCPDLSEHVTLADLEAEFKESK